MVAKVEKATSPQTVRVALELDVPRTRPSSAASTRTTMSPQKQLRPQSASPALTRVQQQRHQVLGWRAYVADPRIFNDAAIGAKARAANSVPALWQASLRRVDVRSILKKESNIAPYSDYAMLEPRPMGVGQLDARPLVVSCRRMLSTTQRRPRMQWSWMQQDAARCNGRRQHHFHTNIRSAIETSWACQCAKDQRLHESSGRWNSVAG